ncbi:PLP-dependent aminotransferase family protein [Hartmannibacter diazotrophicus]|nr:PLP-dependent aminotransferase family protein [Hartmannibacter diazotrophicus]
MAMDIETPTDGGTRIEAVMEAIRSRIAARSLVPGSRLPSIRSLAKSMSLSSSTVVEAYERLAAEGIIRSRPGSGFYVTAPAVPMSIADIGPRLDRQIDPLWVSRQSLEAADEILKPGCGWLPPSWMPDEAIRRALRTLSRGDMAALTNYETPLGNPRLRELLARRLGDYGVTASPGQFILTESGTQAVDLLCRFLLEPGDTVLIDDPCYFNFQALLRAHRVRMVGVPYLETGPDLARFEEVLKTETPRLYITNSGVHNPTGATLSPVVAHRLLMLAAEHGLTIIEDDIFADFEDVPAPRLAAYDGLDRVLSVGSFSKTLSASFRCGFIAARRDWIDSLCDLKIATSFSSGHLGAELVLAVLTDGRYRKHLQDLRVRLARARQETAERLGALGFRPAIVPRAGMFLWCELPEGQMADRLAQACLADGIILAPGNAFSLSQSANRFMRFNVAQSDDPRLFGSLQKAMAG